MVPLWATSTAEAQALLEECCKSYPVGCNPSRVFSSPLVQVFQQITQVDFAPQNLHVVTATQVVTSCEATGRAAMVHTLPDGNVEYPAILPMCMEMQPAGSFSEPEMTTSKLCLDMHRHTAFPDTAASHVPSGGNSKPKPRG